MRVNELKMAHAVDDFEVDVEECQKNLGRALDAFGIDVLVVTSQDMFLSEYNVLANSQRYALSGFTGSTGDGVFFSPSAQKRLGRKTAFVLFVDGRYHIQADKECSSSLVEVVKYGVNDAFVDPPVDWLKRVAATENLVVAVDGQRTSWKRYVSLKSWCSEKNYQIRVLGEADVSGPLQLPGWRVNRPIRSVGMAASGRSIFANLTALSQQIPAEYDLQKTCVISCASDAAAWLLNARGFHMPFNSSVLAYTFAVGTRVVVYLPKGISDSAWEVSPEAGVSVEVVRGDVGLLKEKLLGLGSISSILFSEGSSNAWLPTFAEGVWPGARLVENFDAIVALRAQKTEQEKASMRDAYLRSSRAIANTLRWLKTSPASESLSEGALSRRIAADYAAEGAVELSFATIAASGGNGAIVHYGGASDANKIKDGDIVLLDSGAYYEEGFATDCTRVAFRSGAGVAPEAWQKEIYTVTLKAFLAGVMAVFPESDTGALVDARVRDVCKANGYDYGHGTGHGIGIHVHEGGHRISPASVTPMVLNGAVSVEPGIYLADKGGVRLENVVFVKKDEQKQGHFSFENIMWVGFDWDLIDVSKLVDAEKEWLKMYESQCGTLGTTVTACPL
jgi:Xaa-Pro aminopeptidase